jgi:hypothetical protein
MFRNEYASLEDARKYDLAGVLGRYLNREITADHRFAWTVDRERNVFLIWAGTDRESFATRHTFLLRYAGATTAAVLDKVGGSNLLADPVVTIWKLVDIRPPANFDHTKEDVLGILKEALTEYQVDGIKWPVKNHQAVFQF